MTVSGEVLEHRQHTGVTKSLRVRAGVVRHHCGVRAERPVTDNRVVGCVGNVDDRREIDCDAVAAHLWPCSRANLYTASGDSDCARTRAGGADPISADNRCTRPPSSSTLTASPSGPAECAMAVTSPSFSIDSSVQLAMKIP